MIYLILIFQKSRVVISVNFNFPSDQLYRNARHFVANFQGKNQRKPLSEKQYLYHVNFNFFRRFLALPKSKIVEYFLIILTCVRRTLQCAVTDDDDVISGMHVIVTKWSFPQSRCYRNSLNVRDWFFINIGSFDTFLQTFFVYRYNLWRKT